MEWKGEALASPNFIAAFLAVPPPAVVIVPRVRMVIMKIVMVIAEGAVVGTMLGPALEALFMGSLVRLIQSLMFHIMFAVIAGMIVVLMCKRRQSRSSKQHRPGDK